MKNKTIFTMMRAAGVSLKDFRAKDKSARALLWCLVVNNYKWSEFAYYSGGC
jgi:hypothetical protein